MSRRKASFEFRVGTNDFLQSSPRVVESPWDTGNFIGKNHLEDVHFFSRPLALNKQAGIDASILNVRGGLRMGAFRHVGCSLDPAVGVHRPIERKNLRPEMVNTIFSTSWLKPLKV
jgi:hypothetical protein